MVTEVSRTRTYPVAVEDAFDAVLTADLTSVFRHWYAALPPIREVRGHEDDWGSEGQERTLCFAAGGGELTETLTEVDRPRAFGYRLTPLSGPLGPLAERIDGRWEFTSAGTGVRITWSLRIHERDGAAARVAVPAYVRMWRGYARQGLEELETLLVP